MLLRGVKAMSPVDNLEEFSGSVALEIDLDVG
jgi:hypothetical protein